MNRCCALFLPFCLAFCSIALPAEPLCGVVRDRTGAVVPGAQVTLSAPGAVPAGAVTGDQGSFCLEPPAVGAYTLRVEAAGFLPFAGPVQAPPPVAAHQLEVTLDVPPTVETVEVTADAVAAETTSTQLGQTLDQRKMEAMPLNGRGFTDLMAVQPGIAPVNTAQPGAVVMTGVASTPPSGDANPGNLSISGQRESSNGFRVNGSDVEEDVNMGTSILPTLDSIESFRVLTSNFDAEFGNSSGGQVLVVTRAGEARVHGSAYEFLRNTALDARNYFSRQRAAYRQNQFGGTLGGEPWHRGLALFADYQGTRLTEGIDTGNIAVPTADQRRGLFDPASLTGAVNGQAWAARLSQRLGKTVHAGDPYSEVFANGQIPESVWTAPSRYLLKYVPAPNAGPGLFATTAGVQTLQDDKGGLRADWTVGSGKLTGYYFLDRYSLDNPYPTGTGGASVPGFNALSAGRAQLLALQHTQTFGAAAVNEAHFSVMRNANTVGKPVGGVGPTLAEQGFSGIVPLKPSTEGIENVAFNEFTLGVDTTALVQAENIFEASDAWSRILAHHGLKAGGELHRSQIDTHPDVVFNGSFSFSGSETGSDFADFLLGVPSSYTQGQARSFYNRNLYASAFVQDSWKATPSLTVNFGLRWDRIQPWQEKFNQLQTLVKGQQSQVFPGAPLGLVFPGDKSVAASLAPARHDWAPRAGLAWSPAADTGWLKRITGPSGTTSLRAGYGLFYTAWEGLSAGIMSANPPYGYTYTTSAPPLFDRPFVVAATGAALPQRFPLKMASYGASRARPNATVDWSQFEPLVGIPAVDPADKTPYAEHWMLSVERQLAPNTLVTVSYVGAGAHHLLVLEEANPADPALCLSLGSACGPFNEQAARTGFGPAFGSVELQRTLANSSYHALEATLVHRARRLDLLASYTWARSLDQSAGLPEPVNPVNPRLSRGLSAFDLRHNLVASFRYEVPSLGPRSRLAWLANGWAVSGIARFTTGLPVTMVNNNDTSLLGTIPNGINNNGVDTPHWTGQRLHLRTNPRGGAVFDASQFSLPALGAQGNARRRFFSGPGMQNADLTLSRRMLSRADHDLEFRLECFNAVNHAQFFGPAAVEGNISSGAFGAAVSAMPPRLMQLALKYKF